MNAKLSSGIVRALAMSSALLACSALQAADKPNWSPPRTTDGKPVISGIWSNASMTNLTRPPGVTKLVVTRDEAAALVYHVMKLPHDSPPRVLARRATG